MKREVEPELLDALPSSDRRAIRSRRDLQHINVLMGHARIMARVLAGSFSQRSPRSIVELGAGDGTLLLQLAKHIAARWSPLHAALVDRQRLLSPQTSAQFDALSWRIDSMHMDVFDWLRRPDPQPNDVTLATLFLHHFKDDELRTLLRYASCQTDFFLACEPRRASFPLRAARLLPLLGCNSVTRHDARLSIRAGFAGDELSALWPAGAGWRLTEGPAGMFTHCFVAQRIHGADA